MKYSQYLEFEKLLNENNLTVDDVKENPEVLNEAGLGLIAAIAGGGLAILFRKALLSWGIKSFYLKRLSSFAHHFERTIMNQVSQMAKKSAKYRQNLLAKDKQLRNDESEEAQEERKALAVHKSNYERRLTKEVNSFIDKISEHKTKEVYAKIEDVPALSEGHKLALKSFWEAEISGIRVGAFQKLTDDGIITDQTVLDALKQEAADIKAEAQERMKKSKAIIEKEKKEGEGKEGEGKEGEGKTLSEKVESSIEELYAEKDKMKEEDLLRKIRFIVSDLKKIGDDEKENELFGLLKDKIGLDKIKAAQHVKSAPEKDEHKQTILDDEDKL